MKKGGCWIFLSHSSKDILKVREIRNAFEKNGQNPLAFHLRCLTTDTKEGKEELDKLIKREIDAREWFVFCESDAANQSEYVKMEKEYIKSNRQKKIWTIDMDLSIEEILKKVDEICTSIKVFVSYFKKDSYSLAKKIEEELEKKDFNVWDDELLTPSVSWNRTIRNTLQEAANSGFIIVLLSENYINSSYCLEELKEIMELSKTAKIITLAIGECSIPELLKDSRVYRIPLVPSDEDIHLLVELIEADLKRGIKGPISYQADALNKYNEIAEKINYEKRFHPLDAELVHALGATDDYIEIYRFPCCGRQIVVGDGPVSRFRSDGCQKEEK